MQSNSISVRRVIGCSLYLPFMFCMLGIAGSVFGQFPSEPSLVDSRTNEPSVVRPQGHSLQTPSNNAFPPAAESIRVQPSGQRVFPQNLPPANNTQGLPASGTLQPYADSSVQAASWTTAPSPHKTDVAPSRESIELRPSSKEALNSISKPKSSWATVFSMLFSLAIVLSLFLIIAWLFRRTQPNTFAKLPSEVVQVMGRTAMAPRQQVYVVRFGNKMLLVSHQPGQTQTLGEITDMEEVQRLAGLCEANQSHSITHSFRDVLRQVASGRSDPEPRPRMKRA